MTAQNQENSSVSTEQNSKEHNFRMLEAKYERQLSQERNARQEAEKTVQELQKKKVIVEEDEDDDNEPYVDHKKLAKKLSNFERRLDEKIEKKAEEKARGMLDQDRQQNWMKQNPDFYDVMQHAQKFAESDPELAETILQMPEGFERQKLVYRTIKSMGIHKPTSKEPSIQEKIDANRKSPYYQASQVGTAPYANVGDFSKTGQEQAYKKMQDLKSKLRI